MSVCSIPLRMTAKNDLPTRAFKSQKEWEAWLERNHETPGIWLKFAKKTSGIPTVSYQEAVDSALCYGWIDGQMKSLDDSYYIQRFTARTSNSNWSKINREKAEGWLAKNAIVVTALNPVIGYAQGAALVKEALKKDMAIRDLAIEKARAGELKHRDNDSPVSAEEIENALNDMRRLTESGIA